MATEPMPLPRSRAVRAVGRQEVPYPGGEDVVGGEAVALAQLEEAEVAADGVEGFGFGDGWRVGGAGGGGAGFGPTFEEGGGEAVGGGRAGMRDTRCRMRDAGCAIGLLPRAGALRVDFVACCVLGNGFHAFRVGFQ